MTFQRLALCAALLLGLSATPGLADAPLLIPQTPIVVPGGPGGFDWMTVDRAQGRLYATHPHAGSLTVLDLRTSAVQQIPGNVAGLAVDAPDGKVFVGGANQKVLILDNRTLAQTGEIPVTGPVDDIVFDPKNGTIYADCDDGTVVWVIDAKTEKLAGTVTVPGAPEYVAYDAKTDRLYQNIKPTNCVEVIDPATNKIAATWDTHPALLPHGLAIDPKTNRLFSAGRNGVLVVMDLHSGKVLGSAAIAKGADQIAFDPKNRRIYSASGDGFLSVVQETKDGIKSLGDIPTPKKAHTLAVDPVTEDVWISYTDATASYLQKFSVK